MSDGTKKPSRTKITAKDWQRRALDAELALCKYTDPGRPVRVGDLLSSPLRVVARPSFVEGEWIVVGIESNIGHTAVMRGDEVKYRRAHYEMKIKR